MGSTQGQQRAGESGLSEASTQQMSRERWASGLWRASGSERSQREAGKEQDK